MNDMDNLKAVDVRSEQQSLATFTEVKRQKLIREVATLINSNSLENCVNMPDFIIAQHMVDSFENLVDTVQKSERWKNQ